MHPTVTHSASARPAATHSASVPTRAPPKTTAPAPAPTKRAPPKTTAPAPTKPTVNPLEAQVQAWLTKPDGSFRDGATISADINAIMFGATNYQNYVNDPAGPAAAQVYLDDINAQVTALTDIAAPAIPLGADPKNWWDVMLNQNGFLTYADNAANDTPGDPQTATDIAAIISTHSALMVELQNACCQVTSP